MRIHLRVPAMAIGQRTLRPIVGLMLFGVTDAQQVFQHIAQAEARISADAGGSHGIEDGMDIEIKIALETDQIVFRSVENYLDVPIRKNSAQGADIGDLQRVDQDIAIRRRQLDQAGLAAVGMQAVGFGIASDTRLGPQGIDQMV